MSEEYAHRFFKSYRARPKRDPQLIHMAEGADRALILWRKLKSGRFSKETEAAVRRNNAEMFAKFEKAAI